MGLRKIATSVIEKMVKATRRTARRAEVPHEGVHAPGGTPATPHGLSAADRATVTRARDRMAANEPAITSDMQSLAGKHGGTMEGLEYRLKTQSSLEEKVFKDMDEKGLSAQGTLDQINDGVRYTMKFEPGNYSHGTSSVISDLESQGYRNVNVKNSWDSPGYKGVNSSWEHPSGQRFELQFHTQASFDAKMDTHVLYEQQRAPGVSPELAQQYGQQQEQIFQNVPRPDGVDTIPSRRR